MINPTDLPCILLKTELMYTIKKKYAADKELQAIAIETIYSRYPINVWFHVYTDGSKLSLEENTFSVLGIISSFFYFVFPRKEHNSFRRRDQKLSILPNNSKL